MLSGSSSFSKNALRVGRKAFVLINILSVNLFYYCITTSISAGVNALLNTLNSSYKLKSDK